MTFKQFNRNENPSLYTARISRYGRKIIFNQSHRDIRPGQVGLSWNEETHEIGINYDDRGNYFLTNYCDEGYSNPQRIKARYFIENFNIPRETTYWVHIDKYDFKLPFITLTPKVQYWK